MVPRLLPQVLIHLRSLDVCHFGMIEGSVLKCMVLRSLSQWHDIVTECHKNLTFGSKVIEGETDGQTGR
jgi:hypothetical protein